MATIFHKYINPCLKCGNKGIRASHCGYTTFNPGDARCSNEKCNNIVKVSICGTGDPYKSIRYDWNKANPRYTVKIQRIENEITALRKEKARLKRLFKKEK